MSYFDIFQPVGIFGGVGKTATVTGTATFDATKSEDVITRARNLANISADLSRLNQGSYYAAQIPDIKKAINENFNSIAQTFNKLGEVVVVKDATGQTTTQVPSTKQTGLPGQSITESLGVGFSQAGDFLKNNPLLLLGIIGIVGIKLVKS